MSGYQQITKQPEYSKQAAKYIEGLDRPSKQRIKDAVLMVCVVLSALNLDPLIITNLPLKSI